MPEIRSRHDSAGWRTPGLSAILKDEGFPGLSKAKVTGIWDYVSGKIGVAFQLQKTRSMPHYVLFQIETDQNGIEEEQVRAALAQRGWIIGIQRDVLKPTQYSIFIQTGDHRPLTLRQSLERVSFRKAPHRGSFVLGVNLHQQVLVRNLGSLPHLLFVGEVGTTQNFVRSILATLIMSNTPSELRIGLVGKWSEKYPETIEAPHTLGRTFVSAKQGTRLLHGMMLELRRRQLVIEKDGHQTLDDYNAVVVESGQLGLPRIVLVIDSVFAPEWIETQDDWLPHLMQIVDYGKAVNMNIVMTAADLVSHEALEGLFAVFPTKVMTRNYASNYLNRGGHFSDDILRFIDAVVTENTLIHGAEFPAVTALDIKAIINHWKHVADERTHAQPFRSTGSTGRLPDIFSDTVQADLPSPPTPPRPSPTDITKATDLLSQESLLAADAYAEAVQAESTSETHDEARLIEQDISSTPDYEEAIVSDQDDSSEERTAPRLTIPIETIRQAQALATYLGWLGRGPLIDVLGVSVEDADMIIAMLQARQLLERSNTATPRTRPRRR